MVGARAGAGADAGPGAGVTGAPDALDAVTDGTHVLIPGELMPKGSREEEGGV